MHRLVAVVALISLANSAYAQSLPTVLSSGVKRLAGTEESQHIEYVKIFLDGTLQVRSDGPAQAPMLVPVLIAQCTRRPTGKMYFELLANFGGVYDFAY
jgi:hypothetical protein